MILILSDEEDAMTAHVMDWILHLGGDVLRVNDTDRVQVLLVEPTENRFLLYIPELERTISSVDIGAYWYRRGFLALHTPIINRADDRSLSSGSPSHT